jgi:hypothetical protein
LGRRENRGQSSTNPQAAPLERHEDQGVEAHEQRKEAQEREGKEREGLRQKEKGEEAKRGY